MPLHLRPHPLRLDIKLERLQRAELGAIPRLLGARRQPVGKGLVLVLVQVDPTLHSTGSQAARLLLLVSGQASWSC